MSLSSLIVQREIASIREIEEALARQVLYGGDFVTNLFEVSKIEESDLMPVVAESFGLPVGPAGELPRIPADAVRLVAAEVAAERAFVPLAVGAALVVAVAEPLSRDVEQELTFALALPIEQRIAPLFRIRQALARDYGVPIDKRTARLITKVVHKGPRMASTFPPPLETSPALRAPPRPPSIAAPPPWPVSVEAPRTAATAQGTFVRKEEAPPARPPKRRRGPLTMDVAIGELESSAERDVIFDVLFEFARQFFDYTALFVVHGQLAEGRDAFGDGAPRDKVARVGVPLDMDNILANARDAKRILRQRPRPDGLDAILMTDLGRPGGTDCVVFPIIVRTRVVALLLGDGGLSGVDDIGVRQLEDLVASASGAFERVIMRRKLKAGDAPDGAGGGAGAKRKAESVGPPPTQISAEEEPGRRPNQSEVPAAEELAPPIRDLMTEPVSRVATTTREPTAHRADPVLAGIDPLAVRSDRPPPPNLLAVRRPSGPAIPREEPESSASLAAAAAHGPSPSRPPRSEPPRTKSGGLKRAEAPAFDFGNPSMPSVITENTFGADAAERQLLAQIQGQTEAQHRAAVKKLAQTTLVSESGAHSPFRAMDDAPGPHTTRDGDASRGDRTSPSLEVGGAEPQGVVGHPWADAEPTSEALSEVPFSPRAQSPPPMRAAPVTDVSPQPILPIHSGPITPITDRNPPSLDMIEPAAPAYDDEWGPHTPRPAEAAQMPPVALGKKTLVAGQMPPPVLEPTPSVTANAAPISPLVVVTPDSEMTPLGAVDPDATPLAPAAYEDEPVPASGVLDPVLSLAQRKGHPPVLPPQPEPRPMPASEQQVSVPAHKPPSSRSDHSRILPSVIVDVSNEYVTLVDRVIAGPDESAETDLLRAGGYAMPAIMAKFPGPITVEEERLTHGPLPRVAECGPVIRLVASQRRTALPFVLAHVQSQDDELRFWATYLLTELVYADAIDPAVGRIFDESPRVRLAARTAARALADAHPGPVIDRLADVAKDSARAMKHRVRAIEAIAETREPLAVSRLLPLLEEPVEEIAAATRAALVLITRQDFGLDGERWSLWWEKNRIRHRLEWLIDSLMHEQRALRGPASEELKAITKEYFGYYDDLPKRERERAQARFREWWENVGRVRFSRASSSRGA